ncbi:uracil-DNA glycosylase [Marinilabiliaceae bacterium ANBcel2]|nr:uracil-DNA glycosylase [Marinilabiliaceae bacterium ANBcel2]
MFKLDAHSSWQNFLTSQIVDELHKIYEQISGDTFTPNRENVLRFLHTDLTRAKIVIVGQDPYPQKGVATGRAFEVATLNSWSDKFSNASLRNIVRSLYYSEKGEYLTFNQIREQMGLYGNFQLLAPSKLFKYWESQGVLLLNTSLTCKIDSPASHAKIWCYFRKQLFNYINQVNPGLIWFLWGNHAREAVNFLLLNNALVCNHPMICKEGDCDFLFGKCNHFKYTSDIVDWTGSRV